MTFFQNLLQKFSNGGQIPEKRMPRIKVDYKEPNLRAIYTISQRKTYCKEKIPESRITRKENVENDIFMVNGNGYRKIMPSIRIKNGPVTIEK